MMAGGRIRWTAAACLLGALLLLSSCGGGGGGGAPPPPAPPPALTLTTSSLSDGITNQSYSTTLVSSGGTGTKTWTLASGSLPAGLSLSTAGVISGTPTATGIANFAIQVADAGSPQQTTTRALSIRIANPLSITTTSLPGGIVGDAYDQTMAATGGVTPYNWSVSTGSLPGGLTLDSVSGQISGTLSTAGTFSFTIRVQDASSPAQVVTKDFSVTVVDPLSITTTSLPNGTVGAAYNQSLQASSGTTPLTWSLTSGILPAVLTMASSGSITGTPTTVETANFTVQVADASTPQQIDTQDLTIVIDAAPPVSITTTSLPGGTVNSSYSATLQATGGVGTLAWTLSAGSLPAGLTLGSTGTISGAPTAMGTSNFTVQVTDQSTPTAQTDTQALSIIISAGALSRNDSIATATLLSNGTTEASISPFTDPNQTASDVDVYEITATAGATVTIEICAMRIDGVCVGNTASRLDSVIEIVDAGGTRLTTCRNEGTDDGVTGAPDSTPTLFDDVCLNDDQELGVLRDSKLELLVQSGATTFFVRVLGFRGDARPDLRYQILISGAN